MEIRSVETSRDEETGVSKGHRESRVDENTPWSRMLHSEWIRYPAPSFTKGPHALLTEMGLTVDAARAKEFGDACDSNYDSFYYLGVAAQNGGGDEALKWIMGALAVELKERKLAFSEMSKVLPARVLNSFVLALNAGTIDRNFAKPIFAELMTMRFPLLSVGSEEIATLVADPRFKAADDSVIDDALDRIIAANPDQFEQAKVNPKLIQWFVGQTMKATQGKAKPPAIIQKMQERLSA